MATTVDVFDYEAVVSTSRGLSTIENNDNLMPFSQGRINRDANRHSPGIMKNGLLESRRDDFNTSVLNALLFRLINRRAGNGCRRSRGWGAIGLHPGNLQLLCTQLRLVAVLYRPVRVNNTIDLGCENGGGDYTNQKYGQKPVHTPIIAQEG